jgi:hypothetical protein
MRSVEIAFLLLLAGFLAAICATGHFHYGYSAALMLFPLLAAGATLCIVAIQLIVLTRSPDTAGDAMADRAQAPHTAVGAGAWARLAALFAVVPFVLLAGYPAGFALYLLVVLRRAGEGWAVSGGLAVASLVVSYGLFARLLGVPLPLAPWWWPF